MTDRRFGTINAFGETNQFGASTLDSFFAWGLEIDWDGDGVFDGSNQSRALCGFRISRGRKAMLQTSGNGFEVIPIGRATFTLWNDDGRFDGWNESSPLYPNVTSERDVRFRVRDMLGAGGIQPVFFGEITDIVPMGYDVRPKVNIEVSDAMAFLRNCSPRVAIQNSITLDSAIGAVLDSVNFPTRWGRNLDASADTLAYWWASGERTAAAELEDIANAAFGQFFITAEGEARFVERTNITASVADFDQSDIYKDIFNPQPWVNRRNVMRLKVHPKDSSGTALLYEYFGATPPQILDGNELIIFANYTYNGLGVPALSVITPVPTTDYQIWTTAVEGVGTDKTNDCTVSVTNFGTKALVRITNNTGGTVYLTSFKLRGVAVYEKSVTDVTYPSDPDTVTKPREFFLDLEWLQDANQAADFVNVYGPFLDALHPFPVIKVENRFDLQFGIDLFDTVTLTSEKLGINGVSFRVGGIEHESLDEGCQRVLSTFYLEPYVAGGDYGTFPLTWGTSTFGW